MFSNDVAIGALVSKSLVRLTIAVGTFAGVLLVNYGAVVLLIYLFPSMG